MQMFQGRRQSDSQLEALAEGKSFPSLELGTECPRRVCPPINNGRGGSIADIQVVSQFHHIIKVPFGIVPADVKNIDLAVVAERHGLKLLNATKLPVIGPLRIKRFAV